MNDYPDNWKEIANGIKSKANWCCEQCKHPNDYESGHVLTVHHLNGDKADCRYQNLVALCQRCHLKVQAYYHPDQMFLLGKPSWAIARGL